MPPPIRLTPETITPMKLALYATVLLTVAAAAAPPAADAAELLMFEESGCMWCLKWHEEIGPSYPSSPEGKRAPLRRVRLSAHQAGLPLVRPVATTPTFVLIENGHEIGRITGYPGADFFYWMLDDTLRRLPDNARQSVIAP